MNAWIFRFFVVLWFLDALFTTIFINRHGVEMEANVLLFKMISSYGIWTMWAMKAAVLGFWVWVKRLYKVDRGREFPWYVDAVFVMIMLPVCYMGAVVAFT